MARTALNCRPRQATTPRRMVATPSMRNAVRLRPLTRMFKGSTRDSRGMKEIKIIITRMRALGMINGGKVDFTTGMRMPSRDMIRRSMIIPSSNHSRRRISLLTRALVD